MAKSVGLRAQLLGGLAVILLVATLSVGAITGWATRQQALAARLEQARVLGRGLGAAAAPLLDAGPSGAAALRRWATALAPTPAIRSVLVLDRGRRVRAVVGERLGAAGSDALVRRALLTEQEQVQELEGAEPVVEVVTPLLGARGAIGVLRLVVPLGAEGPSWPTLFWILMAVDSAVLMLFVGLVLSRYVARPVERLQRAAERVARGDLEVRLEEKGAYELTSLAASFNSMTGALRGQLARLEEQRQHLIRSEKLASIGRLAAGVAHEVGNPLQSIVGFTELLLARRELPEEQRDALGRIQAEAQRIHEIVRELLDYSRPVEEAVERTSLGAVVEQALALVGPQQRFRQVTVERVGLENLPFAAASASRLVQVLVNLLLNAADALDGRGRVRLEARLVGGGSIELRVSNDGPPIPPADRGRIFDPFFTTKSPGQGTGLGLAVSQSIVESFGGRLVLADEPDGETTFVMSLLVWVEER
ncbi:MAG: HAMP domain-containing protein [Deltaproteobacteria bacterium]|nr:HAMP domain-containing protein [Deltaproteobacteria bacterium]